MLNRITICGRLTRDPELRHTQNNTPVTTFTVAVDRDFQKDVADFFNCVAWKTKAEFVSSHWKRGQFIVVTGSLQSRQWEDRNGQKRTEWEIQADSVYFGEAKREPKAPDVEYTEVDDDEELPFD